VHGWCERRGNKSHLLHSRGVRCNSKSRSSRTGGVSAAAISRICCARVVCAAIQSRVRRARVA
jgi:hypothetical protein